MRTMIERVARALAANQWPVDFPGTKEQFLQSHWIYHKDDAIAAIEAMREPTDSMLEAFINTAAAQGVAFEEDSPYLFPKPIYAAMIDEALK